MKRGFSIKKHYYHTQHKISSHTCTNSEFHKFKPHLLREVNTISTNKFSIAQKLFHLHNGKLQLEKLNFLRNI